MSKGLIVYSVSQAQEFTLPEGYEIKEFETTTTGYRLGGVKKEASPLSVTGFKTVSEMTIFYDEFGNQIFVVTNNLV
jgi:hypothetical protein